jgi:hypothetical protein
MYVVINGRIAIEATKDTPAAFYHCGAWYIWEK